MLDIGMVLLGFPDVENKEVVNKIAPKYVTLKSPICISQLWNFNVIQCWYYKLIKV